MWWARVEEIINSRNENSENPSRVPAARGFSWRKSILTRDTPSAPRGGTLAALLAKLIIPAISRSVETGSG